MDKLQEFSATAAGDLVAACIEAVQAAPTRQDMGRIIKPLEEAVELRWPQVPGPDGELRDDLDSADDVDLIDALREFDMALKRAGKIAEQYYQMALRVRVKDAEREDA